MVGLNQATKELTFTTKTGASMEAARRRDRTFEQTAWIAVQDWGHCTEAAENEWFTCERAAEVEYTISTRPNTIPFSISSTPS